ncbi:protein of unknown function (plasmid) [Shinella sp. WSC3-e]|nr:protein of unknown function [Shinella sp. WSC3-e]
MKRDSAARIVGRRRDHDARAPRSIGRRAAVACGWVKKQSCGKVLASRCRFMSAGWQVVNLKNLAPPRESHIITLM